MAIVGFEQDPNGPIGAGMFHSDAGESVYAHLPDVAAQFQAQQPSQNLMNAAAPGPDMRLAANEPNMSGGPNASVADVGPNMTPAPPPAPNMTTAPPTRQGTTTVEHVEPTPPPGAPQQEALQAYVNAPVYHAPVKGGLRPKSATVTSEGAEAPITDEDWRAYADANQAIMQAKTAEAGVLRARAENQQAEAEAALPHLLHQRNEAQAEYNAVRTQARMDLQKVNDLVQQTNAKQIDPNRWFKERGAVGGIMAAIAQAFVYGSGQHSVIDDFISRDIAAQKDEIENGRAGANNMLQLLRTKYDFDLPQAESALKIAQQSVAVQQARQFEGMKLSQDAQLGLEQFIADKQKEIFLESRKLYTASMGKQTRKQELAYQPGSPGGYRPPTEKERHDRLATIKESQAVGALPDTGRAGRELDIKEKAAAAKAKNNPGTAKIQDQIDSIDASLANAAEIDRLYAKNGPLTPAERGRLRSLQATAPLEVHKGLTGMSRFSDMEGERYAEAYGHVGDSMDTFGGRRAALGALREQLAHKKAQLKAALAGGRGDGAEPESETPDIQDVE